MIQDHNVFYYIHKLLLFYYYFIVEFKHNYPPMKTQEEKIRKLQKEMDEINKGKTLEEQEGNIVEKYQMKEGNYKVIITVYEASQLEPNKAKFLIFQAQKSACDAFIEVEVRDQKKKTNVRAGTNNPIFQQGFYFSFDNLSVQQLDTSKIRFNVYDKNSLMFANSYVGHFELDWTNIYFRRNHQIYRGWITLSDPKQETEGPVGYLLVNIAVLGPQDKITIHDSAFIKDPLTTIEDTITNQKIKLIDYSISVEVYRAQSLIPLDLASRSVNAYVVAKFSGQKVKTSHISSLNPQWNESLKLGTGVPNKTKYLVLEVWNYNRIIGDDLIGMIKVPFIDIIEDSDPKAVWGHLYGPPMSGKDQPPMNYATKMQIYGEELGSHYRGRIFFKVVGKKYTYTKSHKKDIKFSFPFKPAPVASLKTYTLSVQLIEGFQLPERTNNYIHVAMGQYLMKSKAFKIQNKMCYFFEIFDDKKVQFTEDVQQLPDIILYYADGLEQKNRMSFVRIKTKNVVTKHRTNTSDIYEMKGDKSLQLLKGDEVGGYLTCRVLLYSDMAPGSKHIQNDYKQRIDYQLKIFVYKGQGLPPANVEGDCDPYLKFNVYGNDAKSKVVKESFNPFWNETVDMNVKMQNIFETNLAKGIVIDLYDYEDSGNDQFIGNFLVNLHTRYIRNIKTKIGQLVQFLYIQPKWYYIVNPHIDIGNNIFGKVLLSFALFKTDDIKSGKINPNAFIKTSNTSLIGMQKKTMQIYLIGLRDVRDEKKKIITNDNINIQIRTRSCKCQEENKKRQSFQQVACIHKIQQQYNLQRSSCQINKLYEIQVELPKNKNLLPFMDFRLMYNGKFRGFNSSNLYELLPKLKEKQKQKGQEKVTKDNPNNKPADESDSEETIIDVQGIQNQMKLIYQKRKKDKQRNNNLLNEGNITDLAPPVELGIDRYEQDNNIIAFENLLKAYERTYQQNPDYKYVKQLQQMRNKNDVNRKSRQSQKIIEQEQIEEIEDYHQDSRLLENPVESDRKKETHHMLRKKSINLKGADKEKIKENIKNHGTIFDRIKKKNKITEEEDIDDMRKQQQQELRISKKKSKKLAILDLKDQTNDLQKKKQQVRQAQLRFTTDRNKEVDENQIHFDIKTQQDFSAQSVQEKLIRYEKVQRAMQQEQRDEKQAIQREQQYKFAQAVKLTLFGFNRQKKKKNIQTYEDYDTDEGEDLNIIPQWYKGRRILMADFQQLSFGSKKILTVPLTSGKKIQELMKSQDHAKQNVGSIKMVMMSLTTEKAKEKEEYYTKLLKPRQYYARVYILKGKSLISNYDVKPSTYLRFSYGEHVVSLKDQVYAKEEYNPQYYICHEIPVTLPGSAIVKIEVMETHYFLEKFIDKVLGYTEIDIQERYFMKKWHLFQKKPIQLRNLFSQYGMGTQGRLETWIDLVEKKQWLTTPAHKIHPPPFDPYELRVIVWKTEDCVYKNTEMQSNDIYVRSSVGTSEWQETDTHWACRAIGNFNYRFKFGVSYPPKPEDMYSDVMTIQIWDRDLIGFNNLIGEKRINLNSIHRIIQKAVKRQKPVKASMKIKEKNFFITDRFWFDVFNHKERDQFGQLQTQGRVQMSFQLVPKEQAENALKNGYGRSQPNVYPTMAQPAGRLSFDFFSPLQFLKDILGPNLYKSCCCKLICCLVVILIVFFGFYFLGALIAVSI